MRYGDIVAIGVLDVRHLNQPGKIVIDTPAASPSQLVSVGAGAAAALALPGVVATRTIAIGDGALAVAIAASQDNVVVGCGAGDQITTATGHVLIGTDAGAALTTAHGGVVIGSGAGAAQTGKHNVLIGFGVAPSLTTGENNVVIGAYEDTSTLANLPATAQGHIVIAAEADGEGTPQQTLVVVNRLNTYIGGNKPGNWLTSSGDQNTGVGGSTLRVLTDGIRNTVLGYAAGSGVTGGDSNVYIGYDAASNGTTGDNNIVIGASLSLPAAATSNHLNIGGAIFGALNDGDIRIGGSGAVTGGQRLQVTDTHADTTPLVSFETTGTNGAKIQYFTGTQNPNGTITGDPGDIYFRKSGTSSRPFVNVGAAAGNASWEEISVLDLVAQAQIPIETDDVNDGYVVGSRVYSTAADLTYTCVDATAGAAKWRRDTPLDACGRPVIRLACGGGDKPNGYGQGDVQREGVGSQTSATSTNFHTQFRRFNVTSFEDPTEEIRLFNDATFWRGDAAGLGGFYVEFVVAATTNPAGQNAVYGITSDFQAGPITPANFVNIVAIAQIDGTTNLQLIHNDGSGTCTQVDLGASFPASSTTATYQVILYCKPNDTHVYYVVRRLDSAAVAAGDLSTNLPVSTTFMYFYMQASDNASDQVGADLITFQARY